MKPLFVAIALMVLSLSVLAETRTEKVGRLMNALGLVEMWQEQIDLGEKQGKEIGTQAIDQMLTNLNPSDEFRQRFTNAFDAYVAKLATPWSAQDIVDKWASIYGPHFSDAELDELIAFYSSDLGRKDVSVTKTSMVEFSNYYQEQWKPIMDKAISEFIEELQIVAKECKCTRREP